MSDVFEKAREVLTFWFVETPSKLHFRQDDGFDEEIRRRFGTLHEKLAGFVSPAWNETPETLLAAVLVLDQFSRNLFRDDARAYASDDKALLLAEFGIARGDLDHWPSDRGSFLIMPLMHAEHLPTLERCCAIFEAVYPGNEDNISFARRHREPIARFGRYSKRNAVLGRTSTEAELAFLQEHPSGF